MTFTNAIVVCFQKYANFSGRATRSEFWFFTLFVQLLFLCSTVLDPYVAGVEPDDYLEIYGPVTLIIQIITLLPSLSVTGRRLQDSGMTGWWMLVGLTVIGLIPLIYWLCRPSSAESNKFGDSPVDTFGQGVTTPASALIRFVWIPLGILIFAVSTAILAYHDVMDGGEMGLKVYSGSELSEEHLSLLAGAGLITDDQIQYFYSDELGTVAKSGQFVTRERVVSFVTDDSGNLDVSQMLLNQIDRVEEIRSPGDFTDGEYRVFGNDDAEYDFITLVLPTDEYGKQRFIDALGVKDSNK